MRKIYTVLLIFFLMACSEEKQHEVPDYVLSKEKIVPILVDMHIADATMINLQLEKENKKYQAEIFYEQIFKKYNITRNDLDTSIRFYARIPDYYEAIYDDVLTNINKLSDQIRGVDTVSVNQ